MRPAEVSSKNEVSRTLLISLRRVHLFSFRTVSDIGELLKVPVETEDIIQPNSHYVDPKLPTNILTSQFGDSVIKRLGQPMRCVMTDN